LRAGQEGGGEGYLKRAPREFEEVFKPLLRVRQVRSVVGKILLEERCLRIGTDR
jgi:hypothetical protein